MNGSFAKNFFGTIAAGFVFLLVYVFQNSSAQAQCVHIVDGVERWSTLETSRTMQAAEELFYMLTLKSCSYLSPYEVGTCVMDFDNLPPEIECGLNVCTDGTWSRIYFGSEEQGTWDVVCECATDSDCDDGLWCNGVEECFEGECEPDLPWDHPCENSKYNACDEENNTCVQCMVDSDCNAYGEGLECNSSNWCAFIDNAPAIDSGPYLAGGYWPVLPTSPDTPMTLKKDFSILWTFSDDYVSCNGQCTYEAEYQAVDDSSDEGTLDVDPALTDLTGDSYAGFKLPVMGLTNASTYAVRFTVTDCASQATESGEYYFRALRDDDEDGYSGDEDCDDSNADIYQLLEGYFDDGVDADSDGYGFGNMELVCSGESLPEDYSDSAIDNCPVTPNGPLAGTCYNYYTQTSGDSCMTDTECQDGPHKWYKWCDTYQLDFDGDGIGNVCE